MNSMSKVYKNNQRGSSLVDYALLLLLIALVCLMAIPSMMVPVRQGYCETITGFESSTFWGEDNKCHIGDVDAAEPISF